MTNSNQAQLPKRKNGSRLTFGHLMMIVSGLLAFLLTIGILNSLSKSVVVYVAKADITSGQQITLSQFDAIEVPSGSLDSEYATRSALESGNNFAKRSIDAGEPLLTKAMSPEAIESNVRLQSIPVSRALAVNGAIARGDRVDLIATPGDGVCAYRALRDLEVVAVPGSSSGGMLSSSARDFSITVSLENPGDDLILAGIINNGSFQIVKSTGASNSGIVIEDPQCGNPPNPVSQNDEDR